MENDNADKISANVFIVDLIACFGFIIAAVLIIL